MTRLEDAHREYKRYRPSPDEKVKLANNGLQWVLSSNVSAVGKYNDDLIIRFHNGSLYKYPGQAKLYDPMIASNSKGHFVWSRLRKPKVAYMKIGSLPLPDDVKATDEDLMALVDTQGMAMDEKLRAMGLFIPLATNGLDLIGLNALL